MKISASLTFDDIHPLSIDIEKLSKLFDLLDKYGLKSTVFVTPFYKGKKIGEDKEYVNLLKSYLDNGNEIGIHGYQHTAYEFGYPIEFPFPLFKTQLDKLRKSVKILEDTFHIKIHGFRSPGYGHNNGTIKALEKLNFSYDSSKMVFKPAHIPRHGIRIKTFSGPCPYIINGNMAEIPVTGDYTYNLVQNDFNRSMENMNSDIEFVCKRRGTFIINNHIQCTSVDYDKFLKHLVGIDELKFYRLIDINERLFDKNNGNIDCCINV